MRILILTTIWLLGGCATSFYENMMADGNTWRVKVSDLGECNGYSSVDKCISGLQPLVTKRGTELCGKKPERVFACSKNSAEGELVGVACSVQCNDATTVRLKSPLEPATTGDVPLKTDQEVVKKAKRCQEKGGVWLNNICQIDLGAP
jgi:hypothetical protein